MLLTYFTQAIQCEFIEPVIVITKVGFRVRSVNSLTYIFSYALQFDLADKQAHSKSSIIKSC